MYIHLSEPVGIVKPKLSVTEKLRSTGTSSPGLATLFCPVQAFPVPNQKYVYLSVTCNFVEKERVQRRNDNRMMSSTFT